MTRLSGGLIDRSRRLAFTFDGRRYQGHAGDTLASALLANGVRLVGRSFKYHRPRGIVGSGAEEPNAIMQIGEGAATLPNLRATQVELYDGLIARSTKGWPNWRLSQLAAVSATSGYMTTLKSASPRRARSTGAAPRGATTLMRIPMRSSRPVSSRTSSR